jgi:hypothetical protein
MGKKVNLYLDDATLKLWENIPSGQRSTLVKDAIRTNANKQDFDPVQEMLMKLQHELMDIITQKRELSHREEMLQKEIYRLSEKFASVSINKDDFWQEIESKAITYLKERFVYRSYSGKSRYSIHGAGDGKIRILNVRTKRTTSNFSQKTVDLAIDRLVAGGGKVPVGQFIPVKMHEYTVVALHPRLIVADGYVHWLDQEMKGATEEMLPDCDNDETPDEWTTNQDWLAVLIDGKKGFASVGKSGSFGQTTKIGIKMIEHHPSFSMEGGIWATKYFMFEEPGVFTWGHDGAVHKMFQSP